jgi:hypothetical protein
MHAGPEESGLVPFAGPAHYFIVWAAGCSHDITKSLSDGNQVAGSAN